MQYGRYIRSWLASNFSCFLIFEIRWRGNNYIYCSRSLLMGEQSNAWRILLRNDRKSRHRRIKKQRRYERLAATSQLSLW
ncbi:unnamed protein product [Parnassius mnemosyne]|uniref:Uncharacterized protein n=1 Tax=Parnassius mnemosyne TaxID=213953 RepID=A0AAV1M195_9NEOP